MGQRELWKNQVASDQWSVNQRESLYCLMLDAMGMEAESSDLRTDIPEKNA